jgi:hypothetical protein
MSKAMRDLGAWVDQHGNISVNVTIKASAGTAADTDRLTGANHEPAVIAMFLRQLADDVEAAGRSIPDGA